MMLLSADGFDFHLSQARMELTRNATSVPIRGVPVRPLQDAIRFPPIEKFVLPAIPTVPRAVVRPFRFRGGRTDAPTPSLATAQAKAPVLGDETIRHEVMVTMRRAIVFKVRVRLVITDGHRVLIMSENGASIKGELNWTGETPRLTPKGDAGLEVTDGDNRGESFEFPDTTTRDTWSGILTRLLRIDEFSWRH
jgi:hypothetical protein